MQKCAQLIFHKCVSVKSHWYCTHCIVECDKRELSRGIGAAKGFKIIQKWIHRPQQHGSAKSLMLELGWGLHLATEILKPWGQIYDHRWPKSVEGLRRDSVDTQGVFTAKMFDCEKCRSSEVELETELRVGIEQNRTRGKW